MYELTSVELWRLIIAMFLGGVVIGYLLTSWHQDVLIERLRDSNADLGDTVEHLVAKNDAAKVGLDRLRQYEAIFGKQAIASTSYDVD